MTTSETRTCSTPEWTSRSFSPLRIPAHHDHRFRPNVITDSGHRDPPSVASVCHSGFSTWKEDLDGDETATDAKVTRNPTSQAREAPGSPGYRPRLRGRRGDGFGGCRPGRAGRFD